MEFLISFEDGTINWKSWDQDLCRSQPYEQFSRSLRPRSVRSGLIGYIDLRYNSFDWYAGLGLPNEGATIYVHKYQYGAWTNNQHRKIQLKFGITVDTHSFDHYAVLIWGSYLEFTPSMVLSDNTLIKQYLKQCINNRYGKSWNSTLSEEGQCESWTNRAFLDCQVNPSQ